MNEPSKTALAIHMQISRGPNRGRSHVAGEDRILRSKFVHDFRDVLRMDRRFAGLSDGQFVEVFTCVARSA